MNNILKSLLLIVVMAFSLTGCRDDAELADTGAPINPEKEVIGTYNGTWSVTMDGNTTEYPGYLEITAESAYVGKMKVVCPGRNLDVEVMVNIMKQNPNYRFYNEIPTNPVGAAFAGSISPDGVASMDFQKIEREGRKSYVFNYVFDGKR